MPIDDRTVAVGDVRAASASRRRAARARRRRGASGPALRPRCRAARGARLPRPAGPRGRARGRRLVRRHTNALFDRRGDTRIIYLPTYDLPALDEAGAAFWRGQGFEGARSTCRRSTSSTARSAAWSTCCAGRALTASGAPGASVAPVASSASSAVTESWRNGRAPMRRQSATASSVAARGRRVASEERELAQEARRRTDREARRRARPSRSARRGSASTICW